MSFFDRIHFTPTNSKKENGHTSQIRLQTYLPWSGTTEGWTLAPPTPPSFPTSFSTLAQFRNLLQSHPCWRIFSVVEPTIWHLGDSPKYEWPIHGAQWSRLAMAPSSPPSSMLKTIFNAAVLALFPEINKRGTRSRPWNPRSIKPLWDASTWHKQSDLMTMGKSYSALWDLGGYNSTPFPKHTLVSMSSGPPGGAEPPRGLCSEEDKYMLPGKKMDRCQSLPPPSRCGPGVCGIH